MTTFETPTSVPQASVADLFLAHLAAGEFDRLATVLEPDVTVTALLPDGLREWRGAERVVRAFVAWFGRVDEYELLDASIGQIGPRLKLRWRARVRGGSFPDMPFVVEQQVYADPGPSGRIGSMSMLCSGFAREHGND